jgi:NodT family efflux transporter outer membrane factor (OMF) lipoprotein
MNRFSPVLIAVTGAAWVAFLVGGCAVGPNYRRPDVDAPTPLRGANREGPPTLGTNSLGDLVWWRVFRDTRLQAYIREALTNSWDIRIAAARVLQAEANAKVVRAQFMPSVGAGADVVTSRTSQRGPAAPPAGVDPQRVYGDVFLSMAPYELDLWGRLRRANEAARAGLLSTEASQRVVRQTLVAQVAAAYLNLLELDFELEVARRTLSVRSNSLTLTTVREEGGVASLQDVRQAQILVSTAEATIAETLRRIEIQENEMNLLLGRFPGVPDRGDGFADQKLEAEVPAGLGSDLLQRRPDVLAAEYRLVAANADIGQARAAYFPKVTLTGLYGFQSVALSDLFNSPARTWQFGPSVSFPLFTGGALRGNLKAARARFEESLADYQKTVRTAFGEVANALADYQRTREFRGRQQERTVAHRSAAELASVRYEGGVTSYLEVLYNEQELFNAELALARAQLNELLSVVTLYRSLGGGWQLSE